MPSASIAAMTEAPLLRPNLPPAGVSLTAALVVLLPMLALALLSLWFVQAEQVVRAQDRHRAEQASAAALGESVQHRLDRQLDALAGEVLAQYRAGGAQAVRSFYLSQPDLAMVALFDAERGQVFPEPQELPLLAETYFNQLGQGRLALARATAAQARQGWAGSLFEPSSPVIGCQTSGPLTVCLFLPPVVLRALAQPATLVDPAAPGEAPEGWLRALAPMAPPFAGLAVAVDYRPVAGRSWLAVSLLLAPTLLGTGIAAVYLVFARRARLRAQRLRTDALAEISHELRTPLANLRLYSSMLRDPGGDPARVARLAWVVEDETQRLSGIVENVLAVTVDGRMSGPALAEAVPDDRVIALLDRFAPGLAPMPRPELDLQAATAVRFDLHCFEQVLINLLDNARKHASGARVRVATRLSDRRLVLEVSDDGARHAAPPDGLRGFNLGLNACRSMAARAGGRFEGRITPAGAQFHLTLPLGDPPEPAGARASCAC